MIKQCGVFIQTGEGKFIPAGTAEVDIIIDYDTGCYHDKYNTKSVQKATLNKIKINVKPKDILFEKPGYTSGYY